jgi:3-hydroxybutyryl-CoA dehydrogenase
MRSKSLAAGEDAVTPSPVKTILVAGGGVMGSGIALVCALGGKRVRVLDVDAAALDRSRQAIEQKWRFMSEMALTAGDSARQIDDIAFFPAEAVETAAEGVGLCFEALPDSLDLKREFIGRLNAVMAPPAPIATNSGNLLVDDIVASVAEPTRVLCAHWVNPPHIMPPVEVCPGTHTSPEAVEMTMGCLRDVGKRPILLRRDVPGRIANRLHFAMLNEAIKLINDDIADADDIDAVARYTFIMRHALFGPLGAHDVYGGKDSSLKILDYLYEATGNPVYAPTAVHRARAEAEKAGARNASRWRRDVLPDRQTCDRQVVALMKFLMANETAGHEAQDNN